MKKISTGEPSLQDEEENSPTPEAQRIPLLGMKSVQQAENQSNTRHNAPSKEEQIFLFVLSLFAMLASGSGYAYAAISPSLKTHFTLTQGQIETLGILNNVGGNMGPLIGIFVAICSVRRMLLLTLTLASIGFLGCYITVSHESSGDFFYSSQYFAMSWCLCGFSSNCFYSVILHTNIHNLPQNLRGRGISSLVSFYGLSAGFFTGIYVGFFSGTDLSDFFIVLMCYFLILSLLMMIFFKKFHTSPSSTASSAVAANGNSHSSSLLGVEEKSPSFLSELRLSLRSLMFLVRKPLFWVICFIFFLLSGPGYVFINNLGQLVQSVEDSGRGEDNPQETRNLIILFSIANCLGRLSMGISDFFPWKRGYFLLITSFLMIFGNFWASHMISTINSLYFPCILIGLGYGTLWSNLPMLVNDLFGDYYFSMNFGWICLSGAFASAIFNSVTGKLYEEATPANQGNVCIGSSCFSHVFLFCGILSALAVLGIFWLAPKTKIPVKKGKSEGKLGDDGKLYNESVEEDYHPIH